ncbi:sterile alpha motif domain-containing protein [Trifolium pratense]|uniref:Sterile alpha motif domain-containing protein n=1 Tax=Trifolium pratense TaxID=57577 RepID=A0A2K3NY30_TRIPR|nr:sterile alpha motif domain-containing protein [Trifolium pratense]
MYADRVESGARRSVKERLDGSISVSTRQQRQVTGKSYEFLKLKKGKKTLQTSVAYRIGSRQDDKWEHDLYDDEEKPQITNRKVAGQDLRHKLQKKGLQPATRSGKSSNPNIRDLRERLSGTMNQQPKNSDPPKSKVIAKPSSKSVGAEAPAVKKPAKPAPKKARKADNTTVDDFLLSLGLEKYLITFQAEEVDMAALKHMTDEDLKVMGAKKEDTFSVGVKGLTLGVGIGVVSWMNINLLLADNGGKMD